MRDLRSHLERIGERVRVAPDAFERLERARRRHERNRRITAGVVALSVAVAGSLVAFSAFRSGGAVRTAGSGGSKEAPVDVARFTCDASGSITPFVFIRTLPPGAIGWSARPGCRTGSRWGGQSPALAAVTSSAPSPLTAAAWPSTCSCGVPPSRAWRWSMSAGPRPGRCLGPRGLPRSAVSRVWAGASTAGCSSSRGDRRLTWSPPGDPAGRRRARWTCRCAARPPPSPAAWRPSNRCVAGQGT